MTKRQLFERGKVHVHAWCALNGVEAPDVVESDAPVAFGTCAYYRAGTITISVDECAAEGMAGRAWSYPGYVVDRTPYGVLCHELGHHVDGAEGSRGGVHSKDVFTALAGGMRYVEGIEPEPGFYRKRIEDTPEVEPITGYHDNVLEWFAEYFRLFVTNPDLLWQMRPKAYLLLQERWPNRAEERTWERILNVAPRQLQAAGNKVKQAARNRRPKQGSLA